MISGLGCDIVKHERINLKIRKKVLFGEELVFYDKAADKVEFLASRFAMKEAIVKAMNRQVGFADIFIYNDEDGRPVCNIDGIMLSVSHEKDYSMAVAIKESKDE